MSDEYQEEEIVESDLDDIEEEVLEAHPAPTAKNTVATTLGIGENIEGALCYIFDLFSGIFFLLVEKNNKFIRFHAMQSVVANAIVFILSVPVGIIGIIPIIGTLIFIGWFMSVFALGIFLIFQAFNGEKYELPVVGKLIHTRLNQFL
jgi:uncharacterized membrane protein